MKEKNIVSKNFTGIHLHWGNKISCLRDVNFNKTKFSFEKEETEAAFFHAECFNKMEKITE